MVLLYNNTFSSHLLVFCTLIIYVLW